MAGSVVYEGDNENPSENTVRFEFDAPEFRDHPFTGVVKRNQTLDEVLRLIEKTTNVSFEIVDRTVHVKRTEDAGTISRP